MGSPEHHYQYPLLPGAAHRPLTFPVSQTDPLLLFIFHHPYLVMVIRLSPPLNLSSVAWRLGLSHPQQCPRSRVGSWMLWNGKDEEHLEECMPGRYQGRAIGPLSLLTQT